jgi:hypothetical protein
MKLTHTFLAIVTVLGLGLGRAKADNTNPGIVPNAGSTAQAYSSLAAKWWQWAAETPSPENQVLDETGANCAVNQRGSVWYLAGTFDQNPVSRTCTVPRGKYLFFPIANDLEGAFTTDPGPHKAVPYLRSLVTCVADAVIGATIDGVPVNDPQQYLEFSTPFSIQLPEDNMFGLTADEDPQLLLAPAVDEGYYLYLAPLAPGAHTIHFTSEACGSALDVTYTLTVQ